MDLNIPTAVMSPAEKRMKAASDKLHKADAAKIKAAKPVKTKIVKAVKAAIKANPAKAPAKKVVKAPVDGEVTLKAICAELKIEPRIARRKLRKAKLDSHDARDRWTFKAGSATHTKVLGILKA